MIAEVIRFVNFDFHQQFFDMPGTPLIGLTAIAWTLYYFYCCSILGPDLRINDFTFEHLQQLFSLMRAINLFFFLLSIVLLFILAARIMNKYSACLSSTLLALNWTYAAAGASIRVEPMAMCFMLSAILVIPSVREAKMPADAYRSSRLASMFRKYRYLVAGLLGGIAAACRLHSITATLPMLILLLFAATFGQNEDYQRRFKFLLASITAIMLTALTLLVVFSRDSTYPTVTTYPLAFSLIRKVALAAIGLILILLLLYSIKRFRWFVVNMITANFLQLTIGVLLGFLAGTFTIFTQYTAVLKSMEFYSSAGYQDATAIHLPFFQKVTSLFAFYINIICSDKIALTLLLMGALLVLVLRWIEAMPYLLVCGSFFVSRPLDLVRAGHHVILWLPFYSLLGAVPLALLCDRLRVGPGARRHFAVVLPLTIVLLIRAEINDGASKAATLVLGHAQRLQNISTSREWIRTHIQKNAIIAVAFYCFGPETFYSWIRQLGVPVPSGVDDGWRYILWWGNRSALKGLAGYACVSPMDIPFMKQWELRTPREGIDPLHEKRFNEVESFGSGMQRIILLEFAAE